jgi:type II secretory pathway predicted ATPase ExeA
MYEAFFGLKRKPFSASPDPSMYVATAGTERILKRLTYAARENTGGFLLTGPAGCGKTLLLEKLATGSAASLEFLLIRAGKMDGEAVAAALVRAAGLVMDARTDRNAALHNFSKYLLGKAGGGKNFAIIIDGAEGVDNDGLSVLEMVNDLRRNGAFLATFILSGRESMARRVVSLPGLRDRFTLSARVQPLDAPDCAAYVKGRLAAAGATRELFNEEALAELFLYSKGIPRRINRVADLALLTAFGLEKQLIDAGVMEAVVEELAGSPI